MSMPTADPIALVITTILEQFEATEPDAWDQPAEFIRIQREITEDGIAYFGEAISLPLTVGDSPVDALEYIARMGPMPARLLKDTVALALKTEGWMISTSNDAPDLDQAMADARAHRIHQRPDRLEVRTVLGVDTAGLTYMITRVRGQELPQTVVNDDDTFDYGRTADALRTLLTGQVRA